MLVYNKRPIYNCPTLVKQVNLFLVTIALFIVPQSCSNQDEDNSSEEGATQATKISLEFQKMLDEIGGRKREIDFALKDFLVFPHYNQEEMEDFKVRQPKYAADSSWASSYNDLNTFTDKIYHIKEETEVYETMQSEFEEVLDDEIIPEVGLAMRQFYQVKDMTEFIGINQDLRDALVKMVRMAKGNIDLIYEKWQTYQDLIRAKRFRSLPELETAIREIIEEYKLNPEDANEEEEEELNRVVDKTVDLLDKCQEKERIIRKKLNTFLREEISVVRLGASLWPNSQVDFTLEDEERLKKEEENMAKAAKNVELNNIRRRMITEINLSRSKLKNATIGAEAGKRRGDNDSKDIRHTVRVEL